MNQQLKKQWEQLTARIDALSLRERGIMMIVIAFAIILGTDSLLIEPQFIKQKNHWYIEIYLVIRSRVDYFSSVSNIPKDSKTN